MNTQIISTGSHLPTTTISSTELLAPLDLDTNYGIPTSWMADQLGIVSRHVADPTDKPSDLAVRAAEHAFNKAPHIKKQDIGAVFFCGIERDNSEPATVHAVQDKLGLAAPFATDVSNACYGFIDGIRLAQALINEGAIQYALITTGETNRNLINNLSDQVLAKPAKDEVLKLLGFFSFGDAGGAMIIGPSDGTTGFTKINGWTASQHRKKCYYRPDERGGFIARMDMAKMTGNGWRLQRKHYKATMDELGWENADWLHSHQTGEWAFDKIAELGVTPKDRMICTYKDCGNLTSATFPVSWSRMMDDPRLKAGDRVINGFCGGGFVLGQFGYVM